MTVSAQQPAVVAPRNAATPMTSLAGQELFPSLAPDGSLAYSRLEGQDWDVYVRRPGANPVNLTADSPDNDWQAQFSPDGRWIVFRSDRAGGGIYSMDSNGGSVQRLTTGGFNPSWSPDGKEIVYSTAQIVADPSSRPVPGTLNTLTVATLQRRPLVSAGDAVQPSWSPHNQRRVLGLCEGRRPARSLDRRPLLQPRRRAVSGAAGASDR